MRVSTTGRIAVDKDKGLDNGDKEKQYFEVSHQKLKYIFFFSSRRRHTRLVRDWSSDVCSSDLHGH